MATNLVNLSLSVEGMTCAACLIHVEHALLELSLIHISEPTRPY